jgi:hypothetical protein
MAELMTGFATVIGATPAAIIEPGLPIFVSASRSRHRREFELRIFISGCVLCCLCSLRVFSLFLIAVFPFAMAADSRSAAEEAKRDILEASNVIREESQIGGLMTFNIEYGYLEAMLRGFKSGFLKSYEYRQLCQCETLEDVKLCLGDTDYMNVLQNTSKLTPEIILKKCEDKFVHEFTFLQSQAVGALAQFLDFITYEDLISNISFIITSMIKGSDPSNLLSKCLPLGRSPHLKSVMTFENMDSADGLVELYRTVLIDTPVAQYFETYFNSEVRNIPAQRILVCLSA